MPSEKAAVDAKASAVAIFAAAAEAAEAAELCSLYKRYRLGRFKAVVQLIRTQPAKPSLLPLCCPAASASIAAAEAFASAAYFSDGNFGPD